MKRIILLATLFFLGLTLSYGIEVAKIFTDNMVLQQNDSANFWGWGNAWNKILISTSWGETDTVWVNAEKSWKASVKTPAGSFENQSITITAYGINEDYSINMEQEFGTIRLQNVLIGEVWLCSGQSNMEWSPNSGLVTGETEIPAANYPNIRFFKVKKRVSDYPQDDLAGGEWTLCTSETMGAFSAIGYFFGKSIRKNLDMPVGLISDAWGGIPIDVAYPSAAVQEIPDLFESAMGNYWYGAPHRLGTLYNGMTHPLRSYAIAGMIWYQGEGNAGVHPELYARKQEVLISERRRQFGEHMPFYYVQIAPFNYNNEAPIGTIIRDQQRLASSFENSEMVVVSDVGDTLDIHPQFKKPVGERLANLALKYHYKLNDNLVESPLYQRAYKEKKYVYVEFSFAKGLHFKEGDKGYFEVAGADKEFVRVAAKVLKDKVRLDTKGVEDPLYLRFAYSDMATPFLLNEAGLPASCFSSQEIE
jgi:sialate O-acetylesterase